MESLPYLLVSFGCGALTYLSFERLSIFPIAWFSLSIPIFFLLSKRKYPFLIGFSWAFSFYTISLYWLTGVMTHYGKLNPLLSIAFFLLLVLALSAMFGFIFLLNNLFSHFSEIIKFFLLPLSWVSLEYILSFFLTGFPWNLMGYSQVHFILLIQISTLTGVYGVSFVIILLNTSIAFTLKSRNLKWLLPSTALISFSLIFGLLELKKDFKEEKPIKTAVIQGNTSMDEDLIGDELLLERKLRDYIELTEKAMESKAKLIIWPETSVPILFRYDPRKDIIQNLSSRNNLFILVSFTDWREGKFYNSVFMISPDHSISSVYDKTHLVPFGEYVPFKKILSFFESITKEVGEYTPGNSLVLHMVNGIRFGSPICYEIIFPDLVRRFVKEGAQFLATVSNDGWFGKSDAPYQHFYIAVMRCVENRRYLLRATSTGVSGIIDPFGRVIHKIEMGQMDFASAEIYPINYKTFYSKHGDLFAKFCLTISAIFFILSLGRRYGIERSKKRTRRNNEKN